MGSSRDQNIPLFLWVAAAIVVHLSWGEGASEVVEVLEERSDVRRFAGAVRRRVKPEPAPELALLIESAPRQERPETDPQPADQDPDEDDAEAEDPSDALDRPSPKKAKVRPSKSKAKSKRAASKPRSRPKPPKSKPKPKPKPEPKKAPEPAEPDRPQVVVQEDRRIAVSQEVEDPEQQDNPDAEFIGNKANRVKEQTQAAITATDQHDPSPTPGGAHVSASEAPGNAHETDIAQAEDSPGELNRAPNGSDTDARQATTSQPAGVPQLLGRARSGPSEAQAAQAAQAALEAVRSRRATQPTQAGAGDWRVNEAQRARVARKERAAQAGRRAREAGTPGKPLDLLGLGAEGKTENGVSLNLRPGSAMAAIGQDQLASELASDGERRRSQHRGSWRAVGIERWRASIENYVSTVRVGNTTRLNTAHRPFADYLNRIHNRLHPIFAVGYLGFLDEMPGNMGLNNPKLKTNLEIVLNPASGGVVKLGVTRTSGKTAFDISALESVDRAAPFGPAPTEIVSPDGNVYLHWEFHRDRMYACSTYYARPYIVKTPQKTVPPGAPSGPFAPEEPSAPGMPPRNQQGRLQSQGEVRVAAHK